MATSPLVLGPVLRYVDETSASVWVETRADARVRVHARVRRSCTFAGCSRRKDGFVQCAEQAGEFTRSHPVGPDHRVHDRRSAHPSSIPRAFVREQLPRGWALLSLSSQDDVSS